MTHKKQTSIGIIYGSSTGNTNRFAELLKKELDTSETETTLQDVRNIQPQELLNFDFILLGCSTWENGELQMDFIPFEKEMGKLNLSGKKAAVFGPGDKIHLNFFCTAVDILNNRLQQCGAEIMVKPLKLDILDLNYPMLIKEWTSKILASVVPAKTSS